MSYQGVWTSSSGEKEAIEIICGLSRCIDMPIIRLVAVWMVQLERLTLGEGRPEVGRSAKKWLQQVINDGECLNKGSIWCRWNYWRSLYIYMTVKNHHRTWDLLEEIRLVRPGETQHKVSKNF